jgi:two-component system response regulator QseB
MNWDVTLVTTIAAAKDALTGTLVDVVVLDRRLPDGDGADLASWARARGIATPILMLTALGQLDERVRGLPIGSWTLYLNDHSIDSPYSGRITLSAQETALLATLGGRPNTVFSREQLLDAVGSTDGQVGTIDTYVHHLRRKTDRDLIETVRGRGYRSGTPA